MSKVQARHSCHDCSGSGRVKVLHQENSEGGYWSVEHCSTCKGSGLVVVTTYITEGSGLTGATSP